MIGPDGLVPLPQWPDYGLTDDLLPYLEIWLAQGKEVALATLVSITGSSPRPLGSEMAISSAGDVQGYVSGGCVEAAVAAEALQCLKDRQPRSLDYGAGSPVLDIQLTCGGRIGIFVRPIANLAAYVAALRQAREARQAIIVQTNLETGKMHVSSSAVQTRGNLFVRRYTPPIRLIVAGGDPVTLALLKLAPQFGVEPFLLRPLGPALPPEGLAPECYDRRYLDEALHDLRLDAWSAVYALTHDAHTDLAIASKALKSDAFCVGILGSRRKISNRLAALHAAGITAEDLEKLHLPAGMDINARNPMQIALSILSQITANRPA